MAKERYTERRKPSRRDLAVPSRRKSPLLRVATGVGLLGTLGVGTLLMTRKPSEQAQAPERPITTSMIPGATATIPENAVRILLDENQIDALIGKMDQSMESLYATLSTKLASADPKKRDFLLRPIHFYFQNAKNKERNHIREARTRASLPSVSIQLPQSTPDNQSIPAQNPNFFINGMYDNTHIDAMFMPTEGTLFMPPSFDPSNLYDVTVATHEIDHAWQHNQHLTTGTQQQINDYLSFTFGSRGMANLAPHEVDAYNYQVNLLDILTDGKLARDVKKGRADLSEYRKLLGSRPDQDQQVENLIQMASYLLPEQREIDDITPAFKDVIYDFQRQGGMILYEYDENGMIVPVGE